MAVRSVPIPVDVNKGVDEGAATIEELLAGMNDDVDDITLTEMLAGEDSLDTVISGSDVDNFFDSTEDTPASDDANHVEIDVTEISIKEEVDDDLQFVKYLSKSERETEERLVFSEAMVGSLEDEVSRGCENLDALKAEREVYISSLTAKCEGLKKEQEELKKLALGCETRLEDSDQRYQKLVESLSKSGNHPRKREVRLDKAKADHKQVNGDLEIVKIVIAEKETQFKRLDALNKNLSVAWKVKNSYAVADVKKLLNVPKVEFDRFTEQTSASLAKVFWLSKVTEGKAGAVIVSKMKECLPDLIHQFKSNQHLEISANACDITVFGDFLLSTLGKMVETVEQEAFYKPQRRDHTGEPIKQEGKVANEEVKKVKLVMSGVSKRLKSQSGSKKVQDLRLYSKAMRK